MLELTSLPRTESVMLKVDTVTCVVCGVKEFTKSTGKSARSMNGVCGDHAHLVKGAGDADASPNGTKEFQTSIPEGKSRKS